ncbi:MAG: NTP transferase domain-containing protein, partial [Burkholderiales bacterium]
MNVVVLAAGMGKRMRSDLPKVMHPVAGRPMLAHVFETARALGARLGRGGVNLVGVYGHGGRLVPDAFVAPDLQWVEQMPQRGTGHAVMQAARCLLDHVPTLILYGDVPLTTVDTLERLVRSVIDAQRRFGLLTVVLADPTGYGRVVRGETSGGACPGGSVQRIVEQRDASLAEQSIREVNTGVMVVPTPDLRRWLDALSDDNAQSEYYLTDIVGMAVADGLEVVTVQPTHAWET